MIGARFAILSQIALTGVFVGAPASAATLVHTASRSGIVGIPTAVKLQLRGHLPELGEMCSLRMFESLTTYDAYRNSLGQANIFPPASSLFMSFDREILLLFGAGNDVGGRCLQAAPRTFEDQSDTIVLSWEVGSCGALIAAHYPFILVSMSRTRVDGSAWLSNEACASGPDNFEARTCARLPAHASRSVTSSPVASITATPSPSGTLAPSSVPSATPVALGSRQSTSSPVALATTQPQPQTDNGPNWFFVLVLIGVGFLIGVTLMASRRHTRG